MNRLIPMLPAAAVALGTLLSGACSFTPGVAPFCSSVEAGSATVSSPTGVFGPPDFAGVNRNYTVTATCAVLPSNVHDHRGGPNTTATGSYSPMDHATHEEIAAYGFDLVTTWTCNDDPWLVADVQCSNLTWEQRQGQAPQIDKIGLKKTKPLSAQLLGVNDRRQIAEDLIADFSSKLKQFPNTCSGSAAEYDSRISAPTANQQFNYTPTIPLNVQRAAGCSAAIDGVPPRFDLQWQTLDSSNGQWLDAQIVPSFDGVANPNGITIPTSKFLVYAVYSPMTVRVRARLSGRPNAPWSDYTQFVIVF